MFSTPKFISTKNPALKIAVHDSGDFHSETAAAKPVLFFVHGLGLNSLMWKYAVQHLQSDFRCITIDLPGHGNSWEARGNFTMTFYAQVVRSCIEEMGLKEITLIGHSLGGQISVITALQMPAIVTCLVLVSSAGVETFTGDEVQKIIQGAEFIYKSPIEVNQLISAFTSHFSMHGDRVRELIDDQITQQKERFSIYSEMLLASIKGMLNEPISTFLIHLHQPVLILYGEKDQLIPNKWVHPLMNTFQIEELARQKILHAKGKLLPACGHYLPFEQPALFAESVREFCLATEN